MPRDFGWVFSGVLGIFIYSIYQRLICDLSVAPVPNIRPAATTAEPRRRAGERQRARRSERPRERCVTAPTVCAEPAATAFREDRLSPARFPSSKTRAPAQSVPSREPHRGLCTSAICPALRSRHYPPEVADGAARPRPKRRRGERPRRSDIARPAAPPIDTAAARSATRRALQVPPLDRARIRSDRPRKPAPASACASVL